VVEGIDVRGDPAQATTERGDTRCILCGAIAKAAYVREEAAAARMSASMTGVVLEGQQGKAYRSPAHQDLAIYDLASSVLKKNVEASADGLSPVPDEPTPYRFRSGNLGVYGLNRWSKLFNDRQLLALTTFVRLARQAHAAMLAEDLEPEYAKAVGTYLAFVVDKLADRNSELCRWIGQTEAIGYTFARQALPMVWDFVETNPLAGGPGNLGDIIQSIAEPLTGALRAQTGALLPRVEAEDATRLAGPGASATAVLTDPPYYDSVSYADLSDFFYIWLKRSVGDLYPDLFQTPLTPKAAEIIENPYRQSGKEKAHAFYKEGMAKAFAEMRRVLQPGGISWVVFAHTETEAWENLVSALVRVGFTVTGSWPVQTERIARVRAMDTASLASSVFLICRPRSADAGVAYLHEVSEELRSRIRERLDYFWAQGIRGADFFISAIGPALEVYSRHQEVRTTAGDPVTVKDFLDLVRREVIDYALAQVLHNGLGAVDNETRFYVLWRWAYGSAPLEAGEVNHLRQAPGRGAGPARPRRHRLQEGQQDHSQVRRRPGER
jgi:adenine-specific DNA methylase